MRMPVRCSLWLAGAAMTIVGCSGADVEPPTLPATVEAGEPLVIGAKEYVFSPNRVTIVGADPVTGVLERITLENEGDLAHNIEILEGDVVDRLRSFPAGQRRSLTVALPPGRYRFICTVADHDEKGMKGTIEVKPGGRPR